MINHLGRDSSFIDHIEAAARTHHIDSGWHLVSCPPRLESNHRSSHRRNHLADCRNGPRPVVGDQISRRQRSVLDRTIGVNSNVYSLAYLACNQNLPCMWIAGTLGSLLLLALGGYYLWHNRNRFTTWEAFNIIIPLGFVSTIYLWSYDQLPYVIPIVWVVGTLIERKKSYILVFIFLVVLDVLSIYSLLVQANTQKDLLSIVNTILVLGMCLLLLHRKSQSASLSPSAH